MVQTCAHCHRTATLKRWSIPFQAWYCVDTKECLRFFTSMQALGAHNEQPSALLWNVE